ncbi:MAG: hypothetical protein ACLTZI_14525 [[Eubacterium] siraeum]
MSQKDFFKKYLTKKDDETFLLRDIMQEIHYVPHLMKISDIIEADAEGTRYIWLSYSTSTAERSV